MAEFEPPEANRMKRVKLSATIPEFAIADIEECAGILSEDNNKALTRAIVVLTRLISETIRLLDAKETLDIVTKALDLQTP
jgi:hypothetical protein